MDRTLTKKPDSLVEIFVKRKIKKRRTIKT